MIRKSIALVLGVVAFNLLFFVYTKSSSAEFVIPFVGTLGFFVLIVSAQIYIFLGKPSDLPAKNKLYAQILSSIAILSSLIAIFRASFVDAFLLNLLSLGLSLIVIYLVSLKHPLVGAISEVLVIPQRIFVGWLTAAAYLVDLLPSKIDKLWLFIKNKLSLKGQASGVGAILRGLLITVPIAGIILILLGSADPIFGKLVKDIFNIKLPNIAPWILNRGVGTLIFLLFAAPILFIKIRKKFISPFNDVRLGKYNLETATLVFVLSFIFAAFLVIQFRYLFAQVPETELIQFGVRTYSEYVRRGFGELTLVSVIVYLTSAMSFSIYKVADKSKKILRNLNLVLLFETLIFIISILRRVYLYQLAHGLTRIRVYGSAFLILLLVLTIILMLRQLAKAKRDWHIFEIGACIILVLGIGIINIDKLIANNFPPTVNQEVDYVYISKLSADAVDGWISAYINARKDVDRLSLIPVPNRTQDDIRKIVYSFLTLGNINSNYGVLEWKTKTIYPVYGFRELNFGEQDAYKRLQNSIDKEELRVVFDKSSKLYYSLSETQRYQNFDRSYNTPLVK